MSLQFRIITLRLLYTLSHCRLSHFIISYFRAFALTRFIRACPNSEQTETQIS